jgi:hypothetical protein
MTATSTTTTTATRTQWTEMLVEILLQESLCSSHEEATAIVESIVEDNDEERNEEGSFVLLANVAKGYEGVPVEEETIRHEEMMVLTIPMLVDYLGVTEEVAQSICTKHQTRLLSRIHTTSTSPDMSSTVSNISGEDTEDDDDDSIQNDTDDDEQQQRDAFRNGDNVNEEDNDEEEEIAEGDCEMCERNGIKLTKHHLIPKSTWKKLQPKLKYAWDNHRDGGENQERAHKLLEGTTLFEFFPFLLAQEKKERRTQKSILKQQQQQQPQNVSKRQLSSTHKDDQRRGNGIALSTIRTALGCHTCTVCRPCHTAVHGAHDNLTLALLYSTREALLEDVRIAKFCAWANKQKPVGGSKKGGVPKR